MADGLGYDWWVREWKKENINGRPHMLQVRFSTNTEITGVEWRNSPHFFMHLQDIDQMYVHDLEIFVDILRQKSSVSKGHKESMSFENKIVDMLRALLDRSFGKYNQAFGTLWGARTEFSWPTMPLNTDGIDASGTNVLIENVNITNFDDAVAVKPVKNAITSKSNCTENIEVRNANVFFGVGMSIGSVTPGPAHSCVRNVSFRHVDF